MRLALLELRRRPTKFAAALAILFLISGLLMFLGGLSDGLNANTDGAVRSQDVDLVVYSTTSDSTLTQSQIDAPVRDAVTKVPGVEEVGGLALTQLAARLPDRGPRDLVDLVAFGYEVPFGPLPASLANGQAWADRLLADRGVRLGMTISLGPARTPVTIVGWVDGTGFQGQPSIWVSTAQLESIIAANKPDEIRPSGSTQVLVVRTTGDPTEVAGAIDGATGSTTTLTRDDAAAAVQGIGGGVFNQIIGTTLVVAAAVVGLFFALLIAERLSLYGVFKAIGARNRTIVAGVVAQAASLAAIAAVMAVAVAVVFDRTVPDTSVPFQLSAVRAISSVALVLAAAVAGSAFSLRRILRIDPAAAIGSSS